MKCVSGAPWLQGSSHQPIWRRAEPVPCCDSPAAGWTGLVAALASGAAAEGPSNSMCLVRGSQANMAFCGSINWNRGLCSFVQLLAHIGLSPRRLEPIQALHQSGGGGDDNDGTEDNAGTGEGGAGKCQFILYCTS